MGRDAIRHFKNFLRDAYGVAAVEFALIAPVLIFMMVGVVDYGLYVARTMQTDNLTDAAITYITRAVNNDPALLDTPEYLKNDVVADVTSQAPFTVSEDDVTMPDSLPICECGDGTSVECGGDCGEGDYVHRYVEITVNVSHNTLFSYPGLPDNVQITRTMRRQVQ